MIAPFHVSISAMKFSAVVVRVPYPAFIWERRAVEIIIGADDRVCHQGTSSLECPPVRLDGIFLAALYG